MIEGTSEGRGGVGFEEEEGSIARGIAEYALAAMHAALTGFGDDASSNTKTRASIDAVETLCPRGLDALDSCMAMDSGVVSVLVEEEDSTEGQASPDTMGSPPLRELLTQVMHALLATTWSSDLGSTAANWLDRFVAQSPAARKWAFETIIIPLILASDANEAQAEVCSRFLGLLGPGEADNARGLLGLLVPRLVAAIDVGDSVRSLADSVINLVKCLQDQDLPGTEALLVKVFDSLLFPELLQTDAGGGSSLVKFPIALQASRRNAACREVRIIRNTPPTTAWGGITPNSVVIFLLEFTFVSLWFAFKYIRPGMELLTLPPPPFLFYIRIAAIHRVFLI